MLKCGLLGASLPYSYSPKIHALLSDYEYRLYEKAREDLPDFIRNGDWDGLNVTIPYKKEVLPYCTELSAEAKLCGSVNTLVRRRDGIYGDNTDIFGFRALLDKLAVDAAGRKALVLGSGGACASVKPALELRGARVTVISRSGEDNYSNLARHRDAEIIVNTTPLGTYPGNGESPVDLRDFPNCRWVLDLVYNPHRTALLLQAEELGTVCGGGLHMLVAQAVRSSELFSGESLEPGITERVYTRLLKDMRNVAIIGMPGCGKSIVAAELQKLCGRQLLAADSLTEQRAGMSIPEIFKLYGEAGFRKMESEVLRDIGKSSGAIIVTGGGCVTLSQNYPLLRQNSLVVWIERDTELLAREGRPLSVNADLDEMYAIRRPMYERFAHIRIRNDGTPQETAQEIWRLIK